MRRPLSIRWRLALLFLCADILLVAVFASGVFLFTRHRLLRSFDAALRSNAEALATLTEVDEHSGAIEMEFSDEIMSRFSRHKRPDLFAILGPGGKLVEASRSLSELPEWFGPRDDAEVRDFRVGREQYRGLILPTMMESGEHGGEIRIPITVLFASSTEDLNDDLEDTLVFLIGVGLGISLLSIGGVFVILHAGLRPLRLLASDAEKMGADKLHHRFNPEKLPADLVPFASAFNGLLSRIEEAFARERQFSADAAHELRTPVATMKSGVQAALLTPEDRSGDREALAALLEDIERLEELCEGLLLADRADIRCEETMLAEDVADEVRRVVASIKSAHPERLFRLEVRDLPGGILLNAAPLSVRRIAGNLVENAIRHGGSEAKIDVILEADEAGGLRIVVRDDGPGIPPSVLPNLFKRLSRGDASRSRASGGFGLGLAICRSLVESHGGRIEIVSQEGHGCEVLWTLCVAALPGEAAPTLTPWRDGPA